MSTIPAHASQSSYPPINPKDFNANQPKTIRLYPLSNYTFGTKDGQPEEDPSVLARLKRLEEHYQEHGMRRTCEGILVCHEHNHPHILMLQIANAFFKLPGDYLRAEDDEIEGFKARLNERLAPVGTQFTGEGVNDEWQIGDCLAQWWRPNFETFMYPFIPAHVTRPKECKKLYFIQLPRSKVLSVPKNMKLLAVPLFELYDNTARYGPQLSAIPHLLSRYNFEFIDEDGGVSAVTPGIGPLEGGENIRAKVLAGGEDVKMEQNGDASSEHTLSECPMEVSDGDDDNDEVTLETNASPEMLNFELFYSYDPNNPYEGLTEEEIHSMESWDIQLDSDDNVVEPAKGIDKLMVSTEEEDMSWPIILDSDEDE